MIINVVGDVLGAKTGIIVHGCNAQGVMNSGVALQVKQQCPLAYDYYKAGQKKLGEVTWAPFGDERFIVNAITQEYYGYDKRKYVSYDAVEECFKKIVMIAETVEAQYKFKPAIHFPQIGAGRGGGEWEIISKIIDHTVPRKFTKYLWLMK
jgi:O-acetyl-ADP-ribose deacetylase (regulator of RNase III)